MQQAHGCLWVLVWLFFGGAAFAKAKENAAPFPWIGFGSEGLILVEHLGAWVPETDALEVDQGLDSEAALAVLASKWLGATPRPILADTQRGFWVEGAPLQALSEAYKATRFYVVGASSQCEVEVTEGLKAVMWLPESFQRAFPDDESSGKAPAKPVLRPKSKRDAGGEVDGDFSYDPSVPLNTQTLSRVSSEQTSALRLKGLRAKVLSGTCPLDGVASSSPLSVLKQGKADAETHKVVQALFRKNKWVVNLSKAFTRTHARFAKEDSPCSQGPAPVSIADGALPFHVWQWVNSREQAFALAFLGSAQGGLESDIASIAVAFSHSGKTWVHARDLWGKPVAPLVVQYVVEDANATPWLVAWDDARAQGYGYRMRLVPLDKALKSSAWGHQQYLHSEGLEDEDRWRASRLCHPSGTF